MATEQEIADLAANLARSAFRGRRPGYPPIKIVMDMRLDHRLPLKALKPFLLSAATSARDARASRSPGSALDWLKARAQSASVAKSTIDGLEVGAFASADGILSVSFDYQPVH